MNTRYTYLRDGPAITQQSFAVIRAAVNLSRFSEAEARIAVRIMHASGLVDIAEELQFSPDFLPAARGALLARAPVLCDSPLVAQGIVRRALPNGNLVICTLGSPQVAERANRIGNTRSAAAVDLWADRLEGALVVIGSAPTALFRLLELLDDGAALPAAVIGLPVGFAGAAEAKEALKAWRAANRKPLAFLTLPGSKGGPAMASAAVNALSGEAD